MAAASSPATDEAYGVRRVCAAWGMPRSSFYAARTVSEAPPPGRRRGPRPVVDDAGLLEAIRHDLDRSPFSGEGHRKVWARLRALDGLRVGRDRVLRLMRENALLSPHRGPQRPANDHDGRITTDAPGVMWGTDAAVIPTVEDGNIALFVVVEHWTAEALGWHVAEKADRFAAAQAVDLGQVNRRVEIGSTWYARRVQRTGLNTEAELLLLAHAFLAACAWTLTFFGQKVGPLGDPHALNHSLTETALVSRRRGLGTKRTRVCCRSETRRDRRASVGLRSSGRSRLAKSAPRAERMVTTPSIRASCSASLIHGPPEGRARGETWANRVPRDRANKGRRRARQTLETSGSRL